MEVQEVQSKAPPGASASIGISEQAWVDQGLALFRARQADALNEFCKTPPNAAALESLVRATMAIVEAAGLRFDAEAFLSEFANRNCDQIARLLPSTRDALAADNASLYGITRARARRILEHAAPWKPKSTAPLSSHVRSTAQTVRTHRTSRTRTTVAASASGSPSGSAPPSGSHPRGHDRASDSDPNPAGRIRHQHEWILAGVSTAPAGSLVSFKDVVS